MPKSPTDKVYQTKINNISPFNFDKNVADVFTDMLNRSIPAYKFLLQQLPLITDSAINANSTIYDLGCSLGGASFVLANTLVQQQKQAKNSSGHIIAVDNSKAMIDNFDKLLAPLNLPIKTYCQDICDIEFKPADVIVLNFTLMFVAPELRDNLINKIYTALNKGGILILSEKTKLPTKTQHNWAMANYKKYKRSQGYSDLEISQKQQALKGIMQEDYPEDNKNRLIKAGFEVHNWLKIWQFSSWVAIK